jgi:RNA polymerase sigma-70 factor (sigma-E family)
MKQTEDLVASGAAGAAATPFERLYASEYQGMVRLAFLLLGGHGGHAEEVVQDAFARVYERWERLDEPGAYLRTAVVNRCRDVLRRRLVARRKPPDPPRAAYQDADHLVDALACLAPKRRAAVILRFYADMSEAEIAAALEVRVGTVKSMLHRSLRQLREVVER